MDSTIMESVKPITQEDVERALTNACSLIKNCLWQFTDQFQNAYSENGFYRPIENVDWTNGFWTGELWLAYEFSKDEEFRDAAMVQVASFLRRIENKVQVDHHDMGFLYIPSCVAAYKLTGSKDARRAALLAADQLMSRYQEKGGFFQAWGKMGAREDYRLIIDCLMNVPLLYWAQEQTGNMDYRRAADAHIQTALSNVIREDFSTWHTFFFDPETGEPDHGATCQGYRDGSAWARGQAWGIYGTALAYKYTNKEEYKEIFFGVSDYYIRHLPKDLVPYWDLEFTDGAGQPRDSSSASIAACGMLEMAGYLPEEKAAYYSKAARKFLASLWQNYAVRDAAKSNGLVLHSTYSNHSPYNTCNHYGVDECNSWGDYFYMEALTRMQKAWEVYW